MASRRWPRSFAAALGIASAEAVLEREVVRRGRAPRRAAPRPAPRGPVRRGGGADGARASPTSGRCCWSSTRSSARPARRSSCSSRSRGRCRTQHRLLLVGRRLDPRLRALSRRPPAHRRPRVRRRASSRRCSAGPDHVAHLRRVTQGWPAAADVAGAVARARRHRPARDARRSCSTACSPAPTASGSRGSRALPLLSRDGRRGGRRARARWTLLLDAGLPVRAGRPGLARAPGPRARGARPARRSGCRRRRGPRAAVYADAGELSAALALLAGDGVGGRRAARRAALAGPRGARSRRAARDPLDARRRRRWRRIPFALVQVARLAERTVDFELRVALLRQALSLLGGRAGAARGRGGARRRRCAVTEPGDATEAAARAVLRRGRARRDARTRARALTALGAGRLVARRAGGDAARRGLARAGGGAVPAGARAGVGGVDAERARLPGGVRAR